MCQLLGISVPGIDGLSHTLRDLPLKPAAHTIPQDRVAIVATQPLTLDEDWPAFAPVELRVFRQGVQQS
jgi:predicted glutamine amidotransferase